MKGFLQRILQEIMKKIIILGTSDAWSPICLAQQPSYPVYYIEDWLISSLIKKWKKPKFVITVFTLLASVLLSEHIPDASEIGTIKITSKCHKNSVSLQGHNSQLYIFISCLWKLKNGFITYNASNVSKCLEKKKLPVSLQGHNFYS